MIKKLEYFVLISLGLILFSNCQSFEINKTIDDENPTKTITKLSPVLVLQVDPRDENQTSVEAGFIYAKDINSDGEWTFDFTYSGLSQAKVYGVKLIIDNKIIHFGLQNENQLEIGAGAVYESFSIKLPEHLVNKILETDKLSVRFEGENFFVDFIINRKIIDLLNKVKIEAEID